MSLKGFLISLSRDENGKLRHIQYIFFCFWKTYKDSSKVTLPQNRVNWKKFQS